MQLKVGFKRRPHFSANEALTAVLFIKQENQAEDKIRINPIPEPFTRYMFILSFLTKLYSLVFEGSLCCSYTFGQVQ